MSSARPRRARVINTALVVARLRWLGVLLGVIQAFLTTPPPISRSAMIAVSSCLAAYNIPFMFIDRLPPSVTRILIPAASIADFLVCTAMVLLLANDEFSTSYVTYALVAIEAAVLFRWRGTIWFVGGLVVAMTGLYYERTVFFHFLIQPGSALFRSSIIVLIAAMSGGITTSAERSAEDAQREAERSRVLSAVAARVAKTLRREPVFQAVMESLANLYPNRWHGLLLLNNAGELRLAHVHEPVGEHESPEIPAMFVSELGAVTPGVYATNGLRASGINPPPALARFESAAVINLRGADRTYGLLLALDHEPDAFDADEVRFLESLSSQLSTGLENARLYEEVELLSITDPITALLNRRTLDTRLQHEFRRAERYQHPLSVLMIDIDNFKHYNDSNGHLAGDEVLRRLGELLARDALREVDVAFRYGGEEFAVIMPMTPLSQAVQVADRIRDTISRAPFPFGARQPGGHLSVSVGVAAFPDHAKSPEGLLECADTALYIAKEQGRDQVVSLG